MRQAYAGRKISRKCTTSADTSYDPSKLDITAHILATREGSPGQNLESHKAVVLVAVVVVVRNPAPVIHLCLND